MVARVTYRFPRGAPIIVSLQEMPESTQSSTLLTSRKAILKRSAPGLEVPPASQLPAAEFIITPRAAVGLIAAGFDLTIPAAVSKLLDPGSYVVTPAFGAAGVISSIEDALFIAIDEVTTDSVV